MKRILKVAIASDHAGFPQKSELIEYVRSLGFQVEDFGPESDDRVDYPDFAKKVALKVADKSVDYGILICGTGIGMAIAANKIKGIRAANVTSAEFAHLSREHNDANILTLSGRFVDCNTNKLCVKEFLTTDFAQGRHTERLNKIEEI